jgi:hypothetical protein
MSKQIADELKKALHCVEHGECNSQVLFNAWNMNNLQPHESGAYCGACVLRITNRIKDYIKQHGEETSKADEANDKS